MGGGRELSKEPSFAADAKVEPLPSSARWPFTQTDMGPVTISGMLQQSDSPSAPGSSIAQQYALFMHISSSPLQKDSPGRVAEGGGVGGGAGRVFPPLPSPAS